METLTSIDSAQCRDEMVSLGKYFDSYGDRAPAQLKAEQQRVLDALDEELPKAS